MNIRTYIETEMKLCFSRWYKYTKVQLYSFRRRMRWPKPLLGVKKVSERMSCKCTLTTVKSCPEIKPVTWMVSFYTRTHEFYMVNRLNIAKTFPEASIIRNHKVHSCFCVLNWRTLWMVPNYYIAWWYRILRINYYRTIHLWNLSLFREYHYNWWYETFIWHIE